MKRNLFDELSEGFEALKSEREDKLTLRQHAVDSDILEAPTISSHDLIKLREDLNLSQSLFAYYLRINKRTLENWEQGRAQPNTQAAILIKLVQKYPDTIERLLSV